MWRVWNSLAKGFRYNAASARNGALISEEERDISLALWIKDGTLRCSTPHLQRKYHTDGKNVNKEVPSIQSANCADKAPFLEIIGLSSALALGWQVSHHNWSSKNQPAPSEKRCSLQILANVAFAQPECQETKLNVLSKKSLSAIAAENSSNNHVVIKDATKSANRGPSKQPSLNEIEPEEIMNHIVLNIEHGHEMRKAELLNEAGVRLLSAYQKGETSLFENWISDKKKDKRPSYVHQGFLCFQESRKLGSGKGAFNLGLCYEQGFGTSVDLEKAAECYEEAAELGHSGAQYNLGLLHYQDKLQRSDQAKGIHFIQKAAKQGLDQAWSTLLIVQQNATENSSHSLTSSRSAAEDMTSTGRRPSHFRKSRSEPHRFLNNETDHFEKPLVVSQNVGTSFYIGAN